MGWRSKRWFYPESDDLDDLDQLFSQLWISEVMQFLHLDSVVGPCARSARIATTILLANPAVKQQCLHYCVSARRATQNDAGVEPDPTDTNMPRRCV
ncbi:hypothetical protein MSG28_009282 [Choristoneura fumiferana]|uniref:Uncharacterized protein n=1 Tax=Choristoneura fumiferana TaxID=7141 RepID=A0ACC0KXE5_CHOFU|nr:hypothetical protein MSG28_009282 [Choristoneura fumiferana]